MRDAQRAALEAKRTPETGAARANQLDPPAEIDLGFAEKMHEDLAAVERGP